MHQKKAKKLLEHVRSTYDQIADEFDRTRQQTEAAFKTLARHLQPGANIVDLGCGNGRLLRWLHKITKRYPDPPYHYLGIDNNEKLLQKAKEDFPQENFISGDQLSIPINGNTIDIIFNIRAFHHIPAKKLRLQALNEMRRILKPDGILIITVWNLWQQKYWQAIIKGILRFIITLGDYAPNDLFIPWNKKAKRYYHAFTPLELNKLITKAGFQIDKLHSAGHDIVIIAKPDETKKSFYKTP